MSENIFVGLLNYIDSEFGDVKLIQEKVREEFPRILEQAGFSHKHSIEGLTLFVASYSKDDLAILDQLKEGYTSLSGINVLNVADPKDIEATKNFYDQNHFPNQTPAAVLIIPDKAQAIFAEGKGNVEGLLRDHLREPARVPV